MTKWDMTKRQVTPEGKVIATGQKITPLYDDTSELKQKVSSMETKLEKILESLNDSKDKE
jgi:ubiquinone biosynthesis protein UbiJ